MDSTPLTGPSGRAHRDHRPQDLGRGAERPADIPAPGWKDLLGRVWRRVSDNNLTLVAAGVAFYALLALFPALASLVSLYGLMADPAQVEGQFAMLRPVLPQDAYDLVAGQMHALATHSGQALGAGLVGAILLSLWSATQGTRSLIAALNIVYDEREERGFLRLNLTAFGLTLFLVALVALVMAAVVALPVVLGHVGLGALADTLVLWLRWPALAGVLLVALAVVYRYAPDRRAAKWRWLSWGSGLAVLLWLVASGLFSLYVTHFASYNATYGSLGAVIVLLMWLYISGLVVMLGAQLNAEMERQTARDTTREERPPGGERRRGARGAYVADHLPGDDDRGRG